MAIPRTSNEFCQLAIIRDNFWRAYIRWLNHIQVLCMVYALKWRSMSNTFNVPNKESKGMSMMYKSFERSFVLNLVEFAVTLLKHMCHVIH